MKKIMMILFLGFMLIGQLSVAYALDVEENPLLQTSREKLVKVNLDEATLTVFLIDTSRTMRGNGIQTTINLINRFATESDETKISVISYDDESRTIIEPTKDRAVIQEKLTTLTCQGKSDLTAGLKTVGKLVESKQFSKTNLIIISDNAPTSGETLQKGTYKSKDIYSYKFANASDDYAKVLKSAKVSIRTLAFMNHVASTTRVFSQRFFENIQNDGFVDISEGIDFLFEYREPNQTLLSGQFDYGVAVEDHTEKRDASTQFYYTDDYFKQPSDVTPTQGLSYDPSLATMSLNLELSAWGSPTQADYLFKSNNAKALLTKLDFKDFEANDDFKFKPTKDSIGAVLANKNLKVGKEDYTLLALAIRGGGYESEWASNVTLGTSGQHQGFDKASQDVLTFLDNYIIKHKIQGKIKLWLTGYSRAAATANLVGGSLNNGRVMPQVTPQVTLSPTDMYAFCFEPPAGTLETFDAKNDKHHNIVNIVNLNDVVTKVAPNAENFEFVRYGEDTTLPTKENVGDTQYNLLRDRMLRELEQIESLNDYLLDDFKWKKISLTTKSWIVNDTNERQILAEYLDKFFNTFATEELRNRTYYVRHHQENLRAIMAVLLGNASNKDMVYGKEALKILLDFKKISPTNLVLKKPLLQKFGQLIGIDDLTELNSSALELFLDFAVKHPNLTITLFENLQIIGNAHQPEICLAWLRSQDKNYTTPLPLLQHTRDDSDNHQVEKNYYKTNVVVDGEQYGNILGGGMTPENEKAELYAIPSENGQFEGWIKDNERISTDLACDYTVTGESTLIAKFSARGDNNDEK